MLKINEYYIRQTNWEILIVMDTDPHSKAIGYIQVNNPGGGIIDTYQIGLLYSSIDKLKQAGSNDIFVWEINDKSLRINGNGACWTLRILSQEPPFDPIFIHLTADETELLKQALFK
jgi:hypothetical protein